MLIFILKNVQTGDYSPKVETFRQSPVRFNKGFKTMWDIVDPKPGPGDYNVDPNVSNLTKITKKIGSPTNKVMRTAKNTTK